MGTAQASTAVSSENNNVTTVNKTDSKPVGSETKPQTTVDAKQPVKETQPVKPVTQTKPVKPVKLVKPVKPTKKPAKTKKKPNVNAQLQKVWKKTTKQTKGQTKAQKLQIAVYDNKKKKSYTFKIGNSAKIYTASTVKLGLLYQYLRTHNTPKGYINKQAEKMIKYSDNDAASMFFSKIGYRNGLNNLYKACGMKPTSIKEQHWGLTKTTAKDQVKLLNDLFYKGKNLSKTKRTYIQKLMRKVTPSQRWGVPSGAKNCTAENKNGWLPYSDFPTKSPWIVNSLGHVKNKVVDYTMAIYSCGNRAFKNATTELSAIAKATFNIFSKQK